MKNKIKPCIYVVNIYGFSICISRKGRYNNRTKYSDNYYDGYFIKESFENPEEALEEAILIGKKLGIEVCKEIY